MNQSDDSAVGRRSLIAGLGLATAGLVATQAAQAQSRSAGAASGFRPARHQIDNWFDELPGNHRIFVDSASASGGADAVGYSGNLFRATTSAYADEAADLALVVCFRHMSTPFGYTDAMWEKYGEVFHSLMQYPDPSTGEAPKTNLMNSTAGSLGNRGTTIDSLADRGVQFAVCSMATQAIAGFVARQAGAPASEITDELMANGIRNARFVSAGVMALTRAQEYGYSVLNSG